MSTADKLPLPRPHADPIRDLDDGSEQVPAQSSGRSLPPPLPPRRPLPPRPAAVSRVTLSGIQPPAPPRPQPPPPPRLVHDDPDDDVDDEAPTAYFVQSKGQYDPNGPAQQSGEQAVAPIVEPALPVQSPAPSAPAVQPMPDAALPDLAVNGAANSPAETTMPELAAASAQANGSEPSASGGARLMTPGPSHSAHAWAQPQSSTGSRSVTGELAPTWLKAIAFGTVLSALTVLSMLGWMLRQRF